MVGQSKLHVSAEVSYEMSTGLRTDCNPACGYTVSFFFLMSTVKLYTLAQDSHISLYAAHVMCSYHTHNLGVWEAGGGGLKIRNPPACTCESLQAASFI